MSLLAFLAKTVAVGGGLALWRGKTIKEEADKLQVVFNPRHVGFNAMGIEVTIDVLLKNPSKRDFDFTQPFVTIKYNGRPIAYSQASDKVTKFPQGGQNSFDPITVTIAYTDLLFLGFQVIKDLKDGKAGIKAEAEMTTYTTVLGVVRKEVVKAAEITIKKPKP